MFDADRVVAHVERAIASARIESDPSVHIVVNDLTPVDTYQAILDGIPPPIFFSQRDNTKQNLKLSMLAIAPAWTLETLGFIENTLIPRMMVPALLRSSSRISEISICANMAPNAATRWPRFHTRRPGDV